MKKLSYLFFIITVGVIVSSFKPVYLPPKIYPELEAYFKSVGTGEINKEHAELLESLKSDVVTSHLSSDNWNMIFYCSENTFRSQASQVFTQTLCYLNRHRRIKAFSAGVVTGQIHPKLINYLQRIGYKVTKQDNGDIASYEVKYSDQAKPIVLYSKTIDDKSLPTKDVISVIVCDYEKETECKSLKSITSLNALAFPKVTATDSDETVESVLKSIATEIVYVTRPK